MPLSVEEPLTREFLAGKNLLVLTQWIIAASQQWKEGLGNAVDTAIKHFTRTVSSHALPFWRISNFCTSDAIVCRKATHHKVLGVKETCWYWLTGKKLRLSKGRKDLVMQQTLLIKHLTETISSHALPFRTRINFWTLDAIVCQRTTDQRVLSGREAYWYWLSRKGAAQQWKEGVGNAVDTAN